MAETLNFHFTPVAPPRPDEANVHAKASTQVARVADRLKAEFGAEIGDVSVFAGEHTVFVASQRIRDVCLFLRDELGFTYLVDLAGVDRFTESGRFEVFYNLVNVDEGKRIRLKVRLEEDHAVVPSVMSVFPAANWNERECYDMMGIRFEGHEDLRRMYMPEDFAYHPQRKEFPLLGIPGSLPLPPQTPEGELTRDPFAAAHGSRPIASYEEPETGSS